MPTDPPADRDAIRITVRLAERALAVGDETIARAATSGAVVSRVGSGSTLQVVTDSLRPPAQA